MSASYANLPKEATVNSPENTGISKVMLNSFIPVKIHTHLLQNIVQDRQLRSKYQTNKIIKNAGFFYVLKALSTSGIIKDYFTQINDLCKILGGISKPTFYSLLKGCEQKGWIERRHGNLNLKSFATFTNSMDSTASSFTTIKYEFKTQRINHVLESAYLQLMEAERCRVLNSKINSNQYLKEDLKTVINPDSKGNWQPALKVMQLNTLMFGHDKKYAIFFYNADLGCNTESLRAQFNFKSHESVAYLKKKLANKKLATVTAQRIPCTHSVNKDNRIRGLYTEWDSKTKQVIYILPDKLEHAPLLQN